MREQKIRLSISTALLILGSLAFASTPNPSSVAKSSVLPTIVQGAGSSPGSSSLAQSTTQSIVPQGQPAVDPNFVSNGRAYNATDAQQVGNEGATMASATGSALVASAIPMLMSPLPSVRAAGAILMSEGGMEFAQAAMNKNSANQNGNQAAMLNQANGDTATSTDTSGSSSGGDSAALSSPDLTSLLQSRGINPQDFANQITSGQLTNPQSVLQAMGDTSQYTPTDLQQASQLAAATSGNDSSATASANASGSTSNSSAINKAITYDPQSSNGITGNGGGAAMGGGSPVRLRGVASNAGPFMNGTPSTAASPVAPSTGMRAANSLAVSGNKGESQTLVWPANSVSALLQNATKGGGRSINDAVVKLRGVGITPQNPRQNIFQMAHRNYRGFGKWRVQPVFAQQ